MIFILMSISKLDPYKEASKFTNKQSTITVGRGEGANVRMKSTSLSRVQRKYAFIKLGSSIYLKNGIFVMVMELIRVQMELGY